MLGSVRARLLGVVLNHADARQHRRRLSVLPSRTGTLRGVDVGGLDDAGSVHIVSVEIRSGPGPRHPLRRPLVTTRRASVVLVDLLLTVAGNYFAFWLRFDGAIPAASWDLWRETIPLLVLLRGLSFLPFHLYDSVWRYVGLRDLRAIVASVTASSVLFCLLIRGVPGAARLSPLGVPDGPGARGVPHGGGAGRLAPVARVPRERPHEEGLDLRGGRSGGEDRRGRS